MSDSPRLLKADAARNLGSRVAFNFEDLRERCEAYLGRVRDEAAGILHQARQEAERLKAEAVADGTRAGQAAGLAAAEQEIERRARQESARLVEQRLQSVLPALEQAARQVAADRDTWFERWETEAIDLSAAIARRIVQAQFERHPEGLESRLRELLQLTVGSPRVVVVLHPADASLVHGAWGTPARELAPHTSLEIVADAALGRGDCVVKLEQGEIDARLEAQLDRIVAELTGRTDATPGRPKAAGMPGEPQPSPGVRHPC